MLPNQKQSIIPEHLAGTHMGKSISKRIRNGFYGFFIKRAPRHVLKAEIARRQIDAATRVYGAFLDADAFENEVVRNTSSESNKISGIVAHAVRSVARPSDLFFLPGERRSAREAYSRISGVPINQILTAGWHDEMDFQWNFENSPPAGIPKVDLIASQAIIEHLIDPYKHLTDCFGLLKPGGHMVFSTVIPGFQYHRYPVDCLRFFPDWFEEVAHRLDAQVVLRSMSMTTTLIAYTLRKKD
jgi:SAM-dependent methyltransferase